MSANVESQDSIEIILPAYCTKLLNALSEIYKYEKAEGSRERKSYTEREIADAIEHLELKFMLEMQKALLQTKNDYTFPEGFTLTGADYDVISRCFYPAARNKLEVHNPEMYKEITNIRHSDVGALKSLAEKTKQIISDHAESLLAKQAHKSFLKDEIDKKARRSEPLTRE